jgi:hypothetical protein
MSNFSMPRPNVGDAVLFSTDMKTFSNPAIGWVTGVGQLTINILTFTPGGFVSRNSVHHKDDPDLQGDHGWGDLGCWEFAPSTKALHELMAPAPQAEKSRVRNTADK